jgi:hypothetical protein
MKPVKGELMWQRAIASAAMLLVLAPVAASSQTTYRLRGTVRDEAGKPVAGVRVRAEALTGFRGEQFVGQKEFTVTSNDRGDWSMLGLTSGLWTFEATAPGVIPQVVVFPVSFTSRQLKGARGGAFPWDLPMWVRRSAHAQLTAAAAVASERKTTEAVQAISALANETDAAVLCAAGELALMVRQHGLANALFEQVIKSNPKDACAMVGLASAALMQNNFERAGKMLWAASEIAPRELRGAIGAAVKDLQQITGTQQE